MNELERMIVERKSELIREKVIAELGADAVGIATLMSVAGQLLAYAVGQVCGLQGNEAALRQLMALQIDVCSATLRKLARPGSVIES